VSKQIPQNKGVGGISEGRQKNGRNRPTVYSVSKDKNQLGLRKTKRPGKEEDCHSKKGVTRVSRGSNERTEIHRQNDGGKGGGLGWGDISGVNLIVSKTTAFPNMC